MEQAPAEAEAIRIALRRAYDPLIETNVCVWELDEFLRAELPPSREQTSSSSDDDGQDPTVPFSPPFASVVSPPAAPPPPLPTLVPGSPATAPVGSGLAPADPDPDLVLSLESEASSSHGRPPGFPAQ